MDKAQYARQLQAILDACDEVRENNGWCEEAYATMVRLSPDFVHTPHVCNDDECDLDRIEVRVTSPEPLPRDIFISEDAFREYAKNARDYDRELQDLRGRILSLAADGTISVNDANEVLSAGNLEAIPRRRRWEIGSYHSGWEQCFTTSSDVSEDEARDMLREAWTAFSNALGGVEDDNYEPVDASSLTVSEVDDDGNLLEDFRDQLVPLL